MAIKRFVHSMFAVCLCCGLLSGCGTSKERVLIYSAGEDYKIAYMQERLNEEFPNYDIVIEYISTGNMAAKVLAEGTATDCDIVHDMEYGYMEQLAEKHLFADLSSYDTSIYMDDVIQSKNYLVECRVGGAIIVNTEVLKKKGLDIPSTYEDLLKPEYKGLISMPNPKSSGTGYLFLKGLVNAWGEEKAFDYFEKLTQNILQYTSSGSGPVNALVQGEVAIGLGMTSQAVMMMNEGAPLQVLFFEEGSPYTIYGQSMVAGKEERLAAKEVFDFIVNELTYETVEKFYPEKIYKEIDYTLDNYPHNIVYSDMSNNGIDEKQRLLDKWIY